MSRTQGKRFEKVLVANRGEIAVRIIRALREMGLQAVAVYSDADASSRHRTMADQAIRLPGRSSAETYLQIPSILQAMEDSGATAVHPGYGFLAENAAFAEAVTDRGWHFIGPTPDAMSEMGDKIAAKKRMRAVGVPVVPGSDDPLTSWQSIEKIAKSIGYPLILKAAAGGGGRGMRVVNSDAELENAFAACTREAQLYFGNPAVFCEKYIEKPRHIEFQVLCDEHGHGVHLFERDCSVQRRHQKLLEEAPSTYLNPEQRAHLGELALKAAQAVNYRGAGTVEFICASPDDVYFMEMNTRIQVEHPVTECITGIDLIQAQIRVALGYPLELQQNDLRLNGWSIEARINAEDPDQDFAASPGLISRLQIPQIPFVRVDTHIYPNYRIPSEYDSMVAKVIAWAPTREAAIARLRSALGEMEVFGVPTTIPFHLKLLAHPDFISGDIDTGFLARSGDQLIGRSGPDETSALLAAIMTTIKRSNGVVRTPSNHDRQAWQEQARRENLRR